MIFSMLLAGVTRLTIFGMLLAEEGSQRSDGGKYSANLDNPFPSTIVSLHLQQTRIRCRELESLVL